MTVPSETDTIAALATPAGAGAVALLRVSGPAAGEIADRVFRGGRRTPRRAVFGAIVDARGETIDQVLLTFFKGPASFTGEDTVEITCHGGVLVTRRILERLLQAGARAAEPGEFTRRAFLNGKLDLTQAESIIDVITARTDLALRAANRQLEGALGSAVQTLRDDLTGVVAHVEAYIDFPEEDIDPDTGAALLARLEALLERISKLLATAEQGRVLREGVRTVLAGLPNAGKSSLLNRLLGFERAIVSDVAGTTRDTIEETINLQGFPLRLVDTAGLRENTADQIESEGIRRTRHQLGQADLILEVADASRPAGESRLSLPEDAARFRLLVLNKADLGIHPSWADSGGVPVSCRTGEGLDALADRVVETITRGGAAFENLDIAVNARHKACLERAAGALEAARTALNDGQPPEFVALELRLALEALGEIVGRVDVEDILGVIFSQFCIGK